MFCERAENVIGGNQYFHIRMQIFCARMQSFFAKAVPLQANTRMFLKKTQNIYFNVNAFKFHFLLLNSQICLYFPFKIPKVCTFLWMWWHIVSQLDTNPLKSIKHVKNGCTGAIRSAPSELDYAAGCINVRHLCLFFCLIWEGKIKLCDGTSESVSICLSLFQQGSG